MKKIIKSRVSEHMIDLYSRINDLKKEISIIKNNHLKHMQCSIFKIEKKVDHLLWVIIGGMGALIITFITIIFK